MELDRLEIASALNIKFSAFAKLSIISLLYVYAFTRCEFKNVYLCQTSYKSIHTKADVRAFYLVYDVL